MVTLSRRAARVCAAVFVVSMAAAPALAKPAATTPAAKPAAAKPAATTAPSRWERVGQKIKTLGDPTRIGAEVSRTTTALQESYKGAQARDTSRLLDYTEFKASLFKKEYKVGGVGLKAEGRFERNVKRTDGGVSLDIGKNRIGINGRFTKSFTVAAAGVQVFVGPVPVWIEAAVAASAGVNAYAEKDWGRGYNRYGLGGGVGVGGRLTAAVGVPVAYIGVEGAFNVLDLQLPTTVTVYPDYLDVSVVFIAGMNVTVDGVVQLGYGWFSIRRSQPLWRYDIVRIPFVVLDGTIGR